MTSHDPVIRRRFISWSALCVVFVYAVGVTDAKIINTRNGDIDGLTEDVDGVQVDTYLGIPFAMPPLAELRFRAPQHVQNWTGIRSTTTQPNSCMQSPDTNFNRFKGVEMWNANTNVSEDCLYLNIWVPRVRDGSQLSTMIWIYGGSFIYGSITLDIYNGKYLAAKKSVIVASMQYRMGVQGFMLTGTEEAPGNMGLRDQQMAMQWVHENIDRFGGDPSKITLFGESAGSASVSMHLLAPTSWPFFTNGIMLSGTSLAPWAVANPDKLLLKAKHLASLLNCDRDDSKKMIKCLQKIDAVELENKQWDLNNGDIGTFSPTVDGDFLPNYPSYLISSGKVKDADILLGNTKDEGEYFLVYFYMDIIKEENLWNPKPLNRTDYLDIVGRLSGFAEGIGKDAVVYTYELSNLKSMRGSYMEILDDLVGDYHFKCPIYENARRHAQQVPSKGKTYVYSFEYRHSANPWPSWMGVLHGYEIEMVMGMPFNPNANYSESDRAVSETIMEYFTSFAKKGSPSSTSSVVWPQYTVESEEHIVFTQGNTAVRNGFRTKECTFWNYLAPKLRSVSGNSSTNDATSPVFAITVYILACLGSICSVALF